MGKDGPGRVHVAAFGKHPGWDDSIEEIGLDCDALVQARRILYTEGLAAVAESGAWDKLPAENRVPAFKHAFYWRTRLGLLVGRMWSSRDKRGRAGHPMVVCSLVEGAPAAWAVRECLPRLEQVAAKVSQTNSAELVRLSIGETRRAIEDQVAMLVGAGVGADHDDRAALSALASTPALTNAQGLGLSRVLFEIERGMGAYRAGTVPSDAPAQTLRVPKCLEGPGEGARAWMALVSRQVEPSASLLVIEPLDEPHLDIFVGKPRAKDLVCVRTNANGQGLTTDVPYPIDRAFADRALAVVKTWQTAPAANAITTPTGTASTAPARSGVSRGLAVVAGLGLVGGLIAFLMMRGGGPPVPEQRGGPSEGTNAAAKGSGATPPPTTDSRSAPGQGQAGGAAPAPLEDPRAGWAFSETRARASALIDGVERERAAEGERADPALRDRLDAVSKREADSVRGVTLSPITRDVIIREMAGVDAELRDIIEQAQTRLAASRARTQAFIDAEAREPRVTIEPLKSAWSAAIRSVDPAGGWAKAREHAASMASALREVERAVRESANLDTGGLKDVSDSGVATAQEARRELALRTAADAAARGESTLVREAATSLETWTNSGRKLLEDAARMTGLLAGGYTLDEAGPSGASIRETLKSMNQANAWPELSVAFGPLTGRVEAIEALEASQDPAALLAALRDARADLSRPRVSEAITAWSRLSKLQWPKDKADLDTAIRVLGSDLKPVMERVEDAARRRRVESQALQASRTLWRTFALHAAGTDEGITQGAQAMEPLGADASDVAALPEWIRFNVARRTLARSLDASALLPNAERETAVRAAARTFAADVAPLAIAKDGQGRALANEIREVAAASGRPDLSTFGPGAAGWRFEPGADPASVAFVLKSPGRERRVEFRRVDAPTGDDVCFVATAEMSVGAFADVIGVGGLWSEVRDLLPRSDAGGFDPRPGPRTWEWDGAGIRISREQGDGDLGRGWVRLRPAMAEIAYYPSDLVIERPTRSSPMNHVSPHAALLAARAMNCRLPTPAEWASARAQGQPSGANRRDATWVRQFEHIRQFTDRNPEFPGSGIFRPAEAPSIAPAADGAPAVAQDDGLLWFAPVTQSGERGPFRHLEGNVAEFVCEDGEGQKAVASTRAAVETFVGRGERFRVIGASALSPAEVVPEQPYVMNLAIARGGFSDVGFRVAFSAPRSAAAADGVERVSRALRDHGFLKPE